MGGVNDIRDSDLSGRLNEAIDLARARLHSLGAAAPIAERIDAFLWLARTLRHRGLDDDVKHCLAAANQAVRLSELPACPTDKEPEAQLELAAAKLAAHDLNGCREIARPLADVFDAPKIAARAWHLIGDVALMEGRVFAAIAALLNSIAEHRRLSLTESTATPALLLRAFSRAGHILNANKLRRATNLEALAPRHRVDFLLRLAGHQRRSGRISRALRTLERVDKLLDGMCGMDSARDVAHAVRASCLRDWQLGKQAQEERDEIRRDRSAPELSPSQWRIHPRAKVVFDLIDHMTVQIPTPKREQADRLEEQVLQLQGVPGMERSEALALHKAGAYLAGGSGTGATAERMLRRALVRFEYLRGSGMWAANSRCTLGTLLAATRPEDALDLLVAGIQGVSGERFNMPTRKYRSMWRAAVEEPPYEAAIGLACRLGKVDLAADLVAYSRVAGVLIPEVAPSARRVDRVPLIAPPHLIYLDGKESLLASSVSCRLL